MYYGRQTRQSSVNRLIILRFGIGCRMQIGYPLFLARDVIYTYRAYATISVSVCLSVTEVHCGHGACRKEGRVISCYASHC